MTGFLTALALLGNGLTAGIMLSTVMGIVPLTAVQTYDRYVETIQFLWPRYDPFMPITHVLTVVLDLVLVFLAPEPEARALFGVAGVVLVVVMAISVIKNVPINRYVMSLDPATVPDAWETKDPRRSWRNWNLLRTSLALGGLVVNAAGAAVLM
ncbi:anthrone oxygenase family protein [Spirillospora sp. CA-294931]|uniref:anthrone oxygenase family protein n=1 Tax=Spirillospora sp. CA-294931 TaxID=3240042 RepID=UPI003D91143E